MIPTDQSWGMFGGLDGFGSWDDSSWDSSFGFFTPLNI